jgi:ketosteroid isomerase-like protein
MQQPQVAMLIALEERFAAALIGSDVVALDRLASDDWTIIAADGRILTKAAFLDAIRSGALTHSSMTSDDITVRSFGETALVTARVATTGAYQGKPFTTLERSTDIFARQAGQWRCVLTQLTTIAGPPAPGQPA